MSARTTESAEETEVAPEAPPESETPAGALSEPETTTSEWASPDDLGGDRDWQEVRLPMLGKRVRVRYLGQDDLLPVERLPDMTGLQELGEEPSPESKKASEMQSLQYTAAVVHLAVLATPKNRVSLKPLPCPECEEKHPASLFTKKQAIRLHGLDARAIARVAMPALGGVFLPFSEAPTHPATPAPASSSA